MSIKGNLYITAVAFLGLVCNFTIMQQKAYANEVSYNTKTVEIPQIDKHQSVNNNVKVDLKDNNKVTENTKFKDNKPTLVKGENNQNVISSGTWGTSKWEYRHEKNNYIFHLYAGTLGTPSSITDFPHFGGIAGIDESFKDHLTKIEIDPGVIANVDSSYLFADLQSLTNIQGLENLDTSKVTNMSHMFNGCSNLTSINVSHFNTSNVSSISGMFWNCSSLTSLDVSSFDTSKVIYMLDAFHNCHNLTSLDVSNFNTSKVTDVGAMFADCSNLTNLDLSSFDTSNISSMWVMFSGCSSLTNINLSSFNTSKVTEMGYMFNGCSSLLTLNLSNFNIPKLHFNMLNNCFHLNRLILGIKSNLSSDMNLPQVPDKGTNILGTNKIVSTPHWVSINGYQKGNKYTSKELMSLQGRDQVTTYAWDSEPVVDNTIETKAVTRTINVHQPDGHVQTENQTAMISRSVKNNDDGSKTYGDWSKAQWESYTIPEIFGYKSNIDKITAETITGATNDQTIDVYYEPVEQTVTVQYLDDGKEVGIQNFTGYIGDVITPNYHAPKGYEMIDQPQATITIDGTGNQIIKIKVIHKIVTSSESKTIVRTVNIHYPSSKIKTQNQVAILKRNIYIDQITGQKVYGTWSSDNWDAVIVPTIIGYTPNKTTVASELVTPDSENKIVDIYYTKN